MGVALRQLDFQVVERHDATRQRMDESIVQFTHQLRSGGVGVFYFSGQGVQVQGVNYLQHTQQEARLKQENTGLKTLVGELTLKLKKATACGVDAAPIAPGDPV
jgi:uncharacterized caspase-like protein